MFCFTHQERKVLLFVAVLILIGSLLRFFNVMPGSKKEYYEARVSLVAGTGRQPLINVNRASQEELERIPGVGKVIARRIMEYRSSFEAIRNLEDLKKINGIGDKKVISMEGSVCFQTESCGEQN